MFIGWFPLLYLLLGAVWVPGTHLLLCTGSKALHHKSRYGNGVEQRSDRQNEVP